jgi:hypothetical protein
MRIRNTGNFLVNRTLLSFYDLRTKISTNVNYGTGMLTQYTNLHYAVAGMSHSPNEFKKIKVKKNRETYLTNRTVMSKQSTPCEGLGCGPQETFRNCADVRIVGSRSLLPTQDNPRALFVTDERGIRPLVVRTQTCVATPDYKMFHRPVHAVLLPKNNECF